MTTLHDLCHRIIKQKLLHIPNFSIHTFVIDESDMRVIFGRFDMDNRNFFKLDAIENLLGCVLSIECVGPT